jgi:tetratricopeptide (TPR) repeat protein
MIEKGTAAELGRKLREAASDAGLSLRELGELMGVSRPTIYAYASGALKMSPDRIQQAAAVTGKPVAYFDPKDVDDLDSRSGMGAALKLIDAMLSPSDPKGAAQLALQTIDTARQTESPAIKAELLRRAGNALALKGDFVEAVQNLEAAKTTFVAQGMDSKTGACCQTLGYCYTNLGQLEKARTCFDTAIALLPEESKWKGLVSLAALAEREGRFTDAEQALSNLLDDQKLSDSALVYVRANYSSIMAAQGHYKSAQAQTELALEEAYRTGHADQVLELMIQNGIALTHLGRFDQATLVLMRARDVAFSTKDEARLTLCDLAFALLLVRVGQEGQARELVVSSQAKALQGQYRRSESLAARIQCELAVARGDHELARDYAFQFKSHSMANNYPVALAVANAYLAAAYARLGQPQAARSAWSEGKALADRGTLGEASVLLDWALGLVLESEGKLSEAADVLRTAIGSSESQGLRPNSARIMAELSRIVGILGQSKEAEQLRTQGEALESDLRTKATLLEPWFQESSSNWPLIGKLTVGTGTRS